MTACEYEVGKRYMVTEVHGLFYNRRDWYPVMGALHSDKEIIGFAYLHFHIDWRFASRGQRNLLMRRNRFRSQAINEVGVPLMRNADGDLFAGSPNNFETRQRRLTCKRHLQGYPHGAAAWQARLAEHYASKCLRRGVCPHRGYDLAREPVVDGIVTCPLHGLRWHVESGKAFRPSAPPAADFTSFVASGG